MSATSTSCLTVVGDEPTGAAIDKPRRVEVDGQADTVQRMREIDGVKSTETFMHLDMVKMTYAWGTRP
jgi:hypothetical protein